MIIDTEKKNSVKTVCILNVIMVNTIKSNPKTFTLNRCILKKITTYLTIILYFLHLTVNFIKK